MGRYVTKTSNGSITRPEAVAKIAAIRADGGVIIPQPKEWHPHLVCVVNNGFFGAAGYADTPQEFHVFTDPADKREKVWMLWDKVEQFAQ